MRVVPCVAHLGEAKEGGQTVSFARHTLGEASNVYLVGSTYSC